GSNAAEQLAKLVQETINEAARLGFKRCLVPKTGADIIPKPKDIQLIPASTLKEAIGVGLVSSKTING
ncbi:hypothetical protein ACFLU1_07405, partial [Chloroflexota bacterium]